MKSETCFGKVSGQPLTQYFDLEEALHGAEYAKEYYDNDLSPYSRCPPINCHRYLDAKQ